jgi:recombination protein RecA
MGAAPAIIHHLREQIEKLQASPRELLLALRTGLATLDAAHLFRFGAAVELSGEEGAGKTTLALKAVAAATREKRLAAWIDGPSELYPPAAQSVGVDLSRLLIVRPKAPAHLVWSAVQLLRSGAFACVVLDVLHTGLKLGMVEAKKLLDAARLGGSVLVVLTSQVHQAQGLPRVVMKASVDQGEPCFEIQLPQRKINFLRTQFLNPELALGENTRAVPQVFTVVKTPGLAVASGVKIETQKDKKLEQRLPRDSQGFYGARPGRDSRLKVKAPGDYVGRFARVG